MVFTVVKRTLGLHDTPKPLKGRQVELQNVLTWLIRQQRLHGLDEEEVDINIKLDGRPFWGKRFECTHNNHEINKNNNNNNKNKNQIVSHDLR